MKATCVLTFHRIVDRPLRDHDVSWAAFGELLDRVASDATVVSELESPPDGGRTVALTFDDGTDDHVRVARALASRGLRGIFFVPGEAVGAPRHMTARELRGLRELGHLVGSHSFRHAPLRGLSRDEVEFELRRSRDILSRLLGAEIRYFAPPGGVSNPYLREELERCGYTASRSMRWGLYRSPDERWSIPCVPVTRLTLDRGWIASTLERGELPVAMRSAWHLKNGLPAALRAPLRHVAHAHFARAR